MKPKVTQRGKLDRIDRKILAILQDDASLSNSELSHQIGISPATSSRRLRRLRDEGFIQREIAILDPLLIGKRITAFVEITMERHSAKHKEAFIKMISKQAEVSQCYMITGDTDLLVVVQVADMESFDRFRTRFMDDSENVLRYRTLFSLRRVKFDPTFRLSEVD